MSNKDTAEGHATIGGGRGGGAGGGVFPGFGGIPPAVGTGTAGVAGTASRSDHTHDGVTSVDGLTGVVVLPDAAIGAAGLMSAVDAAKVLETPQDAWAANIQSIMFGAVPGLTRFKDITPGGSGIPLLGVGAGLPAALPAGTADALVEGGGITINVEARWTWGTPFQIPKTGKGAVAFRGALPAIALGKYGHFGICNVARTHFGLIVWTNRGVSATQFALSIIGGATTNATTISAADLLVHDFVIAWDQTIATPTAWLYIDDVIQATITNFANLIDEPMYVETGTNDDGVVAVMVERMAYGAVA